MSSRRRPARSQAALRLVAYGLPGVLVSACAIGAGPAAHVALPAGPEPGAVGMPSAQAAGPSAAGPSAVVTPATSASPATTAPPDPGHVTVDGHRVSLAGVRTVADALAGAGVGHVDGRLLAVGDHRVLRSHVAPGSVLLDGRVAALSAPVHPDDVLVVRRGKDRVEATTTVRVAVAPDVPSNLYVGSTPGEDRVTRGEVSGDVVSRTVVRAPVIGRLATPGGVALTFDDGPDPRWTPQVLALLAQHHVHATFCLIGEQAAAHPDLVRRIDAGGHQLCDHTQDHDEQLPSRSPARIRADISTGRDSIVAASGGVVPPFYRAPGGNWSQTVIDTAYSLGLTPLKWTVDPRDWSRPGTQSILTTVSRELRPGGVILLHDGGGDRSQTVAALTVLLDRLPAQGYTFVQPQPQPR